MYDIEKEFNSYLLYETEIKNYELEIKALENAYDIDSIEYSERTGPTNKTTSITENKYFDKEKKLKYYPVKIKENQNKINKMINATKLLSELEREVIELSYFHSPVLNKKQIEIKLCLSRTAVYRIRKRALNKMKVCFEK